MCGWPTLRPEYAGMSELADEYVLETYVKSVRVQVSLPAPVYSNFNMKGEQLNDYSSIDLYLSKRTSI